MKLYNTLTKQIEEIKPQDPPTVTLYTCGPTVYDYPHIGNWFTFIRYDLFVRTLRASGLQPKWVMNITDVGHLTGDNEGDANSGEDRMEKGARREGKTAWDVAKFYGDYFIDGLKRLNITTPDYLPKATDHITEQIQLVKRLEAKGYTYAIHDGVYFDTSKFPHYRDFAQLDLDEQQAGARVEHNPEKRNPSDFALWKFSPKDHQRDMEWDSPWGKGFPGWHLECSAMSMKYLGETLDIHSGGIDHVPVHHTNEIAQSEAATGKRFVKYWMHTNHITVEGEKISKSLGNGITLEDIEAKGFSLETLRLHVLESHYRSQSKFSWESLEAAQNRLRNWQAFADLKYQDDPDVRYLKEPDIIADTQAQIQAALEDDLSTPKALQLVSALIDSLNDTAFHPPSPILHPLDNSLGPFVEYLDRIFGLHLSSRPDISKAQRALIEQREKARISKDWASADQLREQLREQGIGLRDTSYRAVWYRL